MSIPLSNLFIAIAVAAVGGLLGVVTALYR